MLNIKIFKDYLFANFQLNHASWEVTDILKFVPILAWKGE